DPARCGAGPAAGRDPCAGAALGPDRDAGTGLYPHCTRQGAERGSGPAPPRAAQCADSGTDHPWHAVFVPAGRSDHHRKRLLPAGAWPPDLSGHHPARSDRRAGRGAGAGRSCHPCQFSGRSVLRGRRSEAAQMRVSLILGALLSGLALVAAAVSFFWTPADVTQLAIAQKLLPPSAEHWFGTDHFGRDMLSMIMVGARTSIAVALVAVGIGMGFGVPLGLVAAARSGSWLDETIMRGNDLVFAFPSLVIAILITAALGPSATNAIIAIGIFNIPVFARVTRGAALPLWTLDYVRAAQVAGKGRTRISLQHILPNVASLLIVQGTIQFSLGILAE